MPHQITIRLHSAQVSNPQKARLYIYNILMKLPSLELYDLAEDIGEKTNVADNHPDIVARIERIMTEAHVPNANFPLLPGEQ